MMKTMTATTPPITAWSTPEDVDMAVGSSEIGRRDQEKRRGSGPERGRCEKESKDKRMGVDEKERVKNKGKEEQRFKT